MASSTARSEVVGVAARHLGHQIGGRGRDHDQIGFARQPDMADIELARGIEQVGEDALAATARRPTSGVTNFCAAAVRMQRTRRPRSFSRRMRSSDL